MQRLQARSRFFTQTDKESLETPWSRPELSGRTCSENHGQLGPDFAPFNSGGAVHERGSTISGAADSQDCSYGVEAQGPSRPVRTSCIRNNRNVLVKGKCGTCPSDDQLVDEARDLSRRSGPVYHDDAHFDRISHRSTARNEIGQIEFCPIKFGLQVYCYACCRRTLEDHSAILLDCFANAARIVAMCVLTGSRSDTTRTMCK